MIEWSTSEGLRPAPGEGPDLAIAGDGSVRLGPRFGAGTPVEDALAPAALEELLRFVLDEHGFFAIDDAGLERELAAAALRRESQGEEGGGILAVPLGPPYADAGMSRLAVEARGRRHEVAVHGLFAAAREYPEIEALAHLRAIEERLLALAEELSRRRARPPAAPPGGG